VLCGIDGKASMRRIEVKMAEISDVEDIMNIHTLAVFETAAASYPEEIVRNWDSPMTPEMEKKYIDAIETNDEIIVVAKINGRTVGFGWVVPKLNELRAIYVHPDFGRQGVGAQIVADLERLAAERGLKELELIASLNAEKFYFKHGFVKIGNCEHKIRSGHVMPCVKMRKILIKEG
jgi:putative acetyltransferase